MHITLVSETYFPQVNGVSRALGKLVGHLIEQGDEIQLLLPRYRQPVKDSPRCTRVEFTSIPFPLYKDIRLVFARPATVRRHMLESSPDCVHIATEGPLGYSALKAAEKLGLPLVTSYHTNFCDYLQYYHVGFLKRPAWVYLRSFHNRGHATLGPSRSVCERLETQGFQNVIEWRRGVDCKRFSPLKRDPVLRKSLGVKDNDIMALYVGRIAHEKNLEMLVQAFARLDPALRCKLVLVGDGPVRKRLENSCPERTVFVGYRHGAELSAYYASADLFVFPSITDTFGNVILESMASGLPAVGFNAPGPRDIIQPGKTGIIAEHVTSEALAQTMTLALADRAALKAMGKQARTYAESQNWDAINSVVRDTYLASITDSPTAPRSRPPFRHRRNP